MRYFVLVRNFYEAGAHLYIVNVNAGYYWRRPSHYHTLMPLVSDWTTPLIFSAFTLLTVSVLDVYHTLMPLVSDSTTRPCYFQLVHLFGTFSALDHKARTISKSVFGWRVLH